MQKTASKNWEISVELQVRMLIFEVNTNSQNVSEQNHLVLCLGLSALSQSQQLLWPYH